MVSPQPCGTFALNANKSDETGGTHKATHMEIECQIKLVNTEIYALTR